MNKSSRPKPQSSNLAADTPPSAPAGAANPDWPATPPIEPPANPRPRSAASSALNLMIAQIILRSATDMFSRKVAKRASEAAPQPGDDDPKKRARAAMATTMGLYTANRLAKRSFGGLMLVTGGLVAKMLYDRGTEREWREWRDRVENDGADENEER